MKSKEIKKIRLIGTAHGHHSVYHKGTKYKDVRQFPQVFTNTAVIQAQQKILEAPFL